MKPINMYKKNLEVINSLSKNEVKTEKYANFRGIVDIDKDITKEFTLNIVKENIYKSKCKSLIMLSLTFSLFIMCQYPIYNYLRLSNIVISIVNIILILPLSILVLLSFTKLQNDFFYSSKYKYKLVGMFIYIDKYNTQMKEKKRKTNTMYKVSISLSIILLFLRTLLLVLAKLIMLLCKVPKMMQ